MRCLVWLPTIFCHHSNISYIIHIHEMICLISYNSLSSLEYIIHIHEMPCLTSYNILSSLEYIIHIHEVTLAYFGYPVLGLLVLVLPKLLNYFSFQSFDFERTWWRLFQKRVVRTKFDIYVFIPYSYMQS